jgi:hypothetical protein
LRHHPSAQWRRTTGLSESHLAVSLLTGRRREASDELSVLTEHLTCWYRQTPCYYRG